MKNKKYMAIWGTIIISLIIFSYTASAWGIAVSTNTLQMNKGGVSDFMMDLQNYAGDDPIDVEVQIGGDAEIVEILNNKESHYLPAKTRSYEFPIRISIPAENAKQNYHIDVKFTAHYRDSQGIGIASGKSIPLDIIVADGDAVEAKKVKQYDETSFEPVSDNPNWKKDREKPIEQKETRGIVVEKEKSKTFNALRVGLPFIIIAMAMLFFTFKPKKKNRLEEEIDDLL